MEFNKIFQKYLESARPVKTLINWYDLYEGHSVILEKEFRNKLFKEAINKAGNISELGRKIGTNRKVISSIITNRDNPKIRTLVKIANYINYPLKNIGHKIIEITGLKPKFPFELHNKEGAEIRAAFLSDGHVAKSPIKQSSYCAYEKELHERLVNLCKKIFGEFKTITHFSNKSHITKFPSVIGNALELGGVPKGDKRLFNFSLPKDILLGNKEIQTSYLRRVFDDEGDVCFDNYGKRAVRISRAINMGNFNIRIPSEKWTRFNFPSEVKHNLLLGEQLLLLKLGIDAKLYSEGIYKSKSKNITAKWRIQIGQQDQLKRFAELINFSLVRKRDKLNKILNSYQFRKLPHGKGKEEALNFLEKIYKEKGYFRASDLAKEIVSTGRSYDLAWDYLAFFLKEGIIKKVKRGIYEFN